MDTDNIILASIVVLVLWIIFIRRILGLDVIIKELQSQRFLLQKMAEKAGVSKDDIDFAVGKEDAARNEEIQRMIREKEALKGKM